MPTYTPKQAEYLTFIYYYTRVHGRPPAEREMEWHFRVSPPSVHQMVLTLERNRLITRVPDAARSIRIALDRDQIRELLSQLALDKPPHLEG